MRQRLVLISLFLLAGCANEAGTVNVRILPTEYTVGSVKSGLATPVVDEVVRLQPQRVHVSACHETPPAKVLQFNTELQARSGAKITGGLYEKCPGGIASQQ
ncbi:hypothetical protein [Acidovorax sp. sic0104]|uniref:hypothetical protein n=1 Tax=Acidovorax sp. sic0104 TaxID=2854784 RepID=UPI001C486C66|nr:hypothetical protein [Acidovorax sp. sic0104]MBV7541969.1 hypothetical protein [Acidovorax sp. sic0104]